MDRLLIVANSDKDIDLVLAHQIENYVIDKGARAFIYSGKNETAEYSFLQTSEAAIVLGGDGTMLRAAHELEEYDMPMMGINLGTLGFLTEIEKSNVFKAIDRLLSGDYTIESRMMIEGTYSKNDEKSSFRALNDIVISRDGFLRIIGLRIFVNDQLLDTYEADGVIVSTPTGSTGYNLSAGGPIVSPKSRAIVVTPISPHSLTAKSVVFDSSDNIRIEILKMRKTQNSEAIVSYDGEKIITLSAGDSVSVCKSKKEIKLIKMYDVNFFSVLREKIGGRF